MRTYRVVWVLCGLLPLLVGQGLAVELRRGSELYRAGELEASIEFFQHYVAEHPDSPTAACALYGIGVIREHEGNLSGALEIYRQVSERYPDSFSAREAARKLPLLYAQQPNWQPAAAASLDRLGLLARYWPETLELRTAQQLLAAAVALEASATTGGARWETLRALQTDLETSFPELSEPLRFALGPDPETADNLVRNPGFECDGRYVPSGAPVGWEFLSGTAVPEHNHDGVVTETQLKGYGQPRSGQYCVGKYTHWGTALGWYVQVLRVVPGERYACGVYALTGPAGAVQGEVRLGVDPEGGLDPHAASVIWTATYVTDGTYQLVALNGAQSITAAPHSRPPADRWP